MANLREIARKVAERVGESLKKQAEIEAEAAHKKLLQGSIEAEEEKLGLYVGNEGLPRDNPAHRERYGLDGAWDTHCEDVCCQGFTGLSHEGKPLKVEGGNATYQIADVTPVEHEDYTPRCTYCGSAACPSLNYIPELGRRPLCPRLPSCRLKKAA